MTRARPVGPRAARSRCGRTPSPTTWHPRWATQRCGSWRRRGTPWTCPGSRCAARLTWVTTGQLDGARTVLRKTLDAPSLAGDDPVVVLEPSCAASLRVDLPELLPDDPRAASLAARVMTLAELLDRDGSVVGRRPAERLPRAALSQPHCHQQAVLGTTADQRVLARHGVTVGTAAHRLLRARRQLRRGARARGHLPPGGGAGAGAGARGRGHGRTSCSRMGSAAGPRSRRSRVTVPATSPRCSPTGWTRDPPTGG